MSIRFKNIIAFLIVGFVLFPAATFAARLYLEPASGQYQPGDIFMVEVRLDSQGEYINAVEANLEFPQDILGAVDFSQGNSILTLWVENPAFSNQNGLVSFVGGVPGGYEGTDGLLGKIVFQARETTQMGKQINAKVDFLDGSQVLLNDGLGTKAKLTTKGAEFRILPEKAEVSRDEWQEELEKDKILPESFRIEVSSDPSVFQGKYFIIFSTTDKQTGLDYFEVKEGKRDWKKGESPYLLEDQSLSGIIKVKAVDKAGNVRIAEYILPKKPFPYFEIILILIGLPIIWWAIRKLKKIT